MFRNHKAIERAIAGTRSHGGPSRPPTWTRRSSSLAAASLLLLTLAAPALAKPVDSGKFSGTDSGTECDIYTRESTFSGWFIIKDATPVTNGQFFYFERKLEFTDVISNPQTGAYFTVSGSTLYRETHARLLEGTVFNYHSIEVGQPFVITDMAGRVVLRDVGLIETSYVFDTLGDSASGGAYLEEPELVRVVGPHPGFEDTFDFCLLADQLIG